MGGSGSGRWGGSESAHKTLVEDCRILDIGYLVRVDSVRPNHNTRGGLSWTRNGEKVAAIGYEVETRADEGTFRLLHTVGGTGKRRSPRTTGFRS